MSADLERIRDLPFFPVVPLVPAALLVGSLVMNGLLLWRVSRLSRLLQAHLDEPVTEHGPMVPAASAARA